jgi:hypothetical protein
MHGCVFCVLQSIARPWLLLLLSCLQEASSFCFLEVASIDPTTTTINNNARNARRQIQFNSISAPDSPRNSILNCSADKDARGGISWLDLLVGWIDALLLACCLALARFFLAAPCPCPAAAA